MAFLDDKEIDWLKKDREMIDEGIAHLKGYRGHTVEEEEIKDETSETKISAVVPGTAAANLKGLFRCHGCSGPERTYKWFQLGRRQSELVQSSLEYVPTAVEVCMVSHLKCCGPCNKKGRQRRSCWRRRARTSCEYNTNWNHSSRTEPSRMLASSSSGRRLRRRRRRTGGLWNTPAA